MADKKFGIDISKLIDHSSVGGISDELVEKYKQMSIKEIYKGTDFYKYSQQKQQQLNRRFDEDPGSGNNE